MLVTGAYYPEMSGAGLQTRSLARRLSDQVDFVVLTTTADRSLPVSDRQDGVDVYRVFVDPGRWWSKAVATVRMTLAFLRLSRRCSIVHLHGFSQKSILLVALARLTGKRIAIKLTSLGHDDPLSIQRRGRIAFRTFAAGDAFFAVSPGFRRSYQAARLPHERFHLIPNGVDIERFRPATAAERDALRRELQIRSDAIVVLFVGFFSRDKRPDLVFEAWRALVRSGAPDSVLVFVGATRAPYYEIDRSLADDIRDRAAAAGVADRIRFVEATDEIERFHRAADIFVLPSVREGMSNALLEAMASGVPCIAARLEGVTDVVIEDGRNGVLVPPDDAVALERALRRIVENRPWAACLGREARRTVEARYALERVATRYLDAYRDLSNTESVRDRHEVAPL